MAKKYSYWELRKIQYEHASFKKSQEFIEWLNNEYDMALNEINRDIFGYLSKISEDNQMSLSEAKKLLNDNELKDFHMDLKRFTQLAQGNVSEATEKMLNNASHRFRISKLQAMETIIQANIDRLLNVEQKAVFDHLGKAYKDRFYHMTYDLQKIKGYKHIEGINTRKLNAILNKPWAPDGKNFSQRIWGRNDKIVNELHKELTQNIIRGRSPDEAIKSIAKKFETSKSNAARLVYTESSAINAMADEESYKETGVEKYQISATLDLRTSEICRTMDGRIFDLKDYKVGITAPPFHVYCRTVTIPYFDDFLEDETRAMRNPITGKTEIIKAMKYEEWYKKYVESNPEALIKEKQHKNKFQDRKQYENYKSTFNKVKSDLMPKNFEDFKDLKYNSSKDWEYISRSYRAINSGKYLQEKLDFKDFYTNEKVFIPQFTEFNNARTIAKGNDIRVVDHLVKELGGDISSWKKRVGKIESEKYIFDVHWFELKGKQHKTKVKVRKEKK